ncbi:MAG: ABC transporter ATP-binding protein/permease [Deltaproteobacteria bacterium]|nr:ABC transporter ATP-binding protein/permease [Deltaproteobacteria bacterium]
MSPALKPTLRGRHFVRALWRLCRIYWTSRDAARGALLLLGAVFFEFATVYASLLIAESQRHVVEDLEHRQAADFVMAAAVYVGFLLLLVVVSAYRIYVRQVLEVRWRRDLTAHYVDRWIGPRAYGQSQLHPNLDNPDQRIAEDIRDFVASALGLALSLLAAVATLVSFGGVLWQLSSDWRIPLNGSLLHVPGLLFWVALVAAVISITVTQLVGRRLVPINYDRLRFEADFRYGLVRFRDHVKEVALSRGDAVERRSAAERFQHVYDVFLQLIRAERNLSLVTGGVGQLSGLLPLLLAMPAYFGGLLTLGMILQARVSYDQVSGALSWFVNAYREIARWRANVERLAAFADVMDDTETAFTKAGIQITPDGGNVLRLTDLRLEAPIGQTIVENVNAAVRTGERVALVGPLGKGKSTLFRAIAGIWPFGGGHIERPPVERMHFVPQRPYLPIGSLRAVVSYPAPVGTFTDEKIHEVLSALGVAELGERLDDEEPWDYALSGHEQQILAMARVLLHEPEWVLLDDATSGLGEAAERRIYEVLVERLPRSTVISLGAHAAVMDLLPRRWTLAPRGDGTVTLDAA